MRLSSWMPFEKAAELLGDMLGIVVSKKMSQRYTEAAGAAYVQIQAEEVERLEQEAPLAEAGAEKLQVSVDGAMVPLGHGVWGEVKTLVVGVVQPAVEEQSEWVVHTRNLSYFSRKLNADEYQRLALVEMHRRGVAGAQEVAAIVDGAEWEQGFIDYHCPQATRILDFPHAAEHLNRIGEDLYGEHTPASQAWLVERLHHLKRAGPAELLTELHQLQQDHPESASLPTHLAYLEKRREQLQYPDFQAQGWPLGSGIVESGNKLVVETRLKGAGMHWAEGNINPMLALRNIICSDRWQEAWPQIELRLRQNARTRQQKIHLSRQIVPLAPPASPPPAPRIDARLLQAAVDRLDQNEISKQSKPNPWRNFKFGKALYQSPSPPKN